MSSQSQIDTLYQSCKQLKELFYHDMTALLTGRNIQNTPVDYIYILRQLGRTSNELGIKCDGFDSELQKLVELSDYLENEVVLSCFVNDFFVVLNKLLVAVIAKRNHYCIIKRNDSIPGLASHILTNLGQIESSINDGCIPVIDMMNAENNFTELSRKTEKNAWELFFKQPFGITLEDIPSDAIITTRSGIPSFMPTYDMGCLTNPDLMNFWRKQLKDYMPISELMHKEVERTASKLPFYTGSRILGVLCRGTDYVMRRPYNHPVQPKISEVLEEAEQVMKAYNCEYCYLATEDENIAAVFKERFGDKLLLTQDIYYSSAEEDAEWISQKHVDPYAKNKEYLIALYLLSQCTCFIGGRTSGTVIVSLLSDEYEYFYTWNKGRYGIDDMPFARL